MTTANELEILNGRYQIVCAQLGHKGLQRDQLEAEIRELQSVARVLASQVKDAEAVAAKTAATQPQESPGRETE